MRFLQRVLWAQSACLAIGGVLLAGLPKLVLVTLFHQVHYPEYAWIRIVGVQAFVVAMIEVLVAQRIEQLWWWSWAFVIATGAIGLISLLNATIGLPAGSSAVLWWLFVAFDAVFGAAFLWGLFKANQDQPFIE